MKKFFIRPTKSSRQSEGLCRSFSTPHNEIAKIQRENYLEIAPIIRITHFSKHNQLSIKIITKKEDFRNGYQKSSWKLK